MPTEGQRPVLFLVASLLIAQLAGCATSTLTPSEAKPLANLSLVDFLNTRFQDRQSVVVKNTIRYLAYFNDVNYRQLERPTTELSNFCRAGGGTMSRSKAFLGNPVGDFFYTPSQNALKKYQQLVMTARPNVETDAALQSILLHYQRNVILGAADAKKAYSEVLEKGTFGTWVCTYQKPPHVSWQVDVIPIIYAPPSDPGNLLTNHRMILEVTPLQE